MGEKNKKNNEGEQKNEGNNKKKDHSDVTVVLRTDLHCEGCASKVIKCIRSFEGVDTATVGDGQKITVVGQIDPIEIREKLEQKTHKKVELISPQIKKDSDKNNSNKENNSNNNNAKGKDNSPKDKKEDHKKEKKGKKKKVSKDSPSKDKSDDDKKSKEKELPVTTAVFKVHLHCEGCVHKIYKTVTKTKGFEDINFDDQKDLVTVKGAMDMKSLAELLQKQLKKDVQIVQPKKEGEKKEKDNGDKGTNSNDKVMDANNVMHAHQMGYPNLNPFMYGSDPFPFNPYTVGSYHAPQIFSDENPNACSVM